MPAFAELAPDQQAVLQLLLKQGKSYDDIAGMLRLDPTGVRERALDALDALGADAADDLSPERQDEIADHLLGQQPAAERDGTRAFLEHSAPGRAWARRVAAELRPIGGDALPELPAEPAPVAATAGDGEHRGSSARAAFGEPSKPASRRGGALVLLGVALLVGLGAFLLLRGGDDESATRAAAPVTADGATGATGAGGLPQQQINLKPPSGSNSKALAFAIVAQGQFAMQAEGLSQSDLYDVWLYNSRDDALVLGFAQYDRQSKRLVGASALPEEAAKYGSVVITRQRVEKPTRPGTIVLRGPIKRQ